MVFIGAALCLCQRLFFKCATSLYGFFSPCAYLLPPPVERAFYNFFFSPGDLLKKEFTARCRFPFSLPLAFFGGISFLNRDVHGRFSEVNSFAFPKPLRAFEGLRDRLRA